jgi:hypothetical protein
MNSSNLESIFRALTIRGWCFIPQELARDPFDIFNVLGPILSLPEGVAYRDLIPYDDNIAPAGSMSAGSMSAKTGTDAQPMHTDAAYNPLPPRYIALQCLEPGEEVCPTDVWAVDLARLTEERPEILTKPNWVARGGGRGPFYCSVMDVQCGEVRLRFDPFCMHAISNASHTINQARQVLCHYLQKFSIEWEKGSLLIIDNWRCLHARGSGADRAPSRRLRRWSIGVSYGLVF